MILAEVFGVSSFTDKVHGLNEKDEIAATCSVCMDYACETVKLMLFEILILSIRNVIKNLV